MSFEFSYNNEVSASKKRPRDANDEAASAVDPRKRAYSLCTTSSGERTHGSSSETADNLVVRVKCAGRDELPCLEVLLEPEATVSTLKESLAIILCSKEKERSSYPVVPVERQRLIHRGRLLRDDDALLVDDVGMSVDPSGGSDVVHLAPLPEHRPSTKTTTKTTTTPHLVGDVDLSSYEEDVHRANVRSLLLQRRRIMDSVLSSVRATMDATAGTAASPLLPGLFGAGATTSFPFPVEGRRYGALRGHVRDGVAPLPALATAPAYAPPLDLFDATTTTNALSPLAAILRPAPSYDPYRVDVVGTPSDVLSRRGPPPPTTRSSFSAEAIVSDGSAAERLAAALLASRRRAGDDGDHDRSLRDARWTPY